MRRNDSTWLEIGFVKEPHGLKGELYIQLFSQEPDWLGNWKDLHLKPRNAELVPVRSFPLGRVKPHRQGVIIATPDLADRTQAEAFKGWTVLIPAEDLVAPPGETPYLHEILGAAVEIEGRGEIGTISGFSSNGLQDLLVVSTAKGPVEIPFVEAFTVDIDYVQRRIRLDLPEGLLEINDREV